MTMLRVSTSLIGLCVFMGASGTETQAECKSMACRSHSAPPSVQYYLGQGVTEEQKQAVLAQIDNPIPSGAAVFMEVLDEDAADSNEKTWGLQLGELPPGFAIKPLDDPNNPYKERYGTWDTWLFENYSQLCQKYGFDRMTENERWEFRLAPHQEPQLQDDDGSTYLVVRGDGFVMPRVLVDSSADTGGEGFVGSWGSTVEYHGVSLAYDVYTAFRITSCGHMDDGLQAAMQQAVAVARAPSMRPIPKWLADNPPMWVQFIPNDEIITLGTLGSWNDETALSTPITWCRFDNNGDLLGQTHQTWWFELFFPDFEQVIANLGGFPRIQFHEIDGTLSLFRDDTHEELALLDYRGNHIEDPFKWVQPAYLFDIFEGRDIPAMYAAQQADPARPGALPGSE